HRTVRKRITYITGVMEQRFDCCPNSCMSYAMFDDSIDKCLFDECAHPRWKISTDGIRSPHATYSYIPITRRLQLWWSNKQRARKLIEYRLLAEKNRERGIRVDFWSGDLYQDLKHRKNLFSQDTDLAFAISTDGVKVFKSRR
ncbi:hypothetical protein BZA77DRAFT_220346, partial [Pyronema omphalodes]